jgi:hypothetical protein
LANLGGFNSRKKYRSDVLHFLRRVGRGRTDAANRINPRSAKPSCSHSGRLSRRQPVWLGVVEHRVRFGSEHVLTERERPERIISNRASTHPRSAHSQAQVAATGLSQGGRASTGHWH